jgi:hypothetical protein
MSGTPGPGDQPVAYVRVQRYDTPDVVTFAAVRQDSLPAALAASDRVETVQACELALPAELVATLAAQLYAAPVRPVRAVIGDVTGDTWATGPLKDKPRPWFWQPGYRSPGYRCTYYSPGGYRCDMDGEGLRQCPAHQPGTRWDA